MLVGKNFEFIMHSYGKCICAYRNYIIDKLFFVSTSIIIQLIFVVLPLFKYVFNFTLFPKQSMHLPTVYENMCHWDGD